MTNAVGIVERYFTAFYAGDGATARQYLRDDNFSFSGPNVTFDSADRYAKMADHVGGPLLTRVDRHKVFVDGPDVCLFYDLVTAAAPASATQGSRVRMYRSSGSGSSPVPGCGASRCTGMWVCSGT